MGLIRGAGHDVFARACEEVSRSEAEVIKDSCDLIAIAGGDGTAGRIAKLLLGCAVPLTFLPLGTANNLSRTLGLLDLSLEQIVAGWGPARTRWLDVGVIDGPWGSNYFIEGVGVGLFTRTMLEIDAFDSLAHLNTPQEKIASALAIMRQRLETFPALPMKLSLDGRDLSGDYLMVEAMNIRFVGPNLYVAPGCDPSDGLLDVVLVGEAERDSMLANLASWREGTLEAPTLPTYRGAHLRIDWRGSALHVDDEVWPPEGAADRPGPWWVDISVRKHALQVIVP